MTMPRKWSRCAIEMYIKVCQAKFCNVSIVSNRGFNFCILFHDTNGTGRKVSEVSCSWAMDHIHFSVIKVAWHHVFCVVGTCNLGASSHRSFVRSIAAVACHWSFAKNRQLDSGDGRGNLLSLSLSLVSPTPLSSRLGSRVGARSTPLEIDGVFS